MIKAVSENNDISADELRKHLKAFNITDISEQYFDELSYGQRKKLCLALALSKKAELLVLDEPTNHLDAEGVEHLLDVRGVRRTSSSIAVPKRGSCAMIASRSSARRLSDMAPINIAATLGMDEPTNHLDAEGVEHLLDVLRQRKEGILVCTHDKRLDLSWSRVWTAKGGELIYRCFRSQLLSCPRSLYVSQAPIAGKWICCRSGSPIWEDGQSGPAGTDRIVRLPFFLHPGCL